jgi:hypothetical protein
VPFGALPGGALLVPGVQGAFLCARSSALGSVRVCYAVWLD